MLLQQNTLLECNWQRKQLFGSWFCINLLGFLKSDIEFKEGETEHFVEVEILYDGIREMREAFTIHLKADENMVAETQVTTVDNKSCHL